MAAQNNDSMTIILILLRLGFFILTVFVKHWLLIVYSSSESTNATVS